MTEITHPLINVLLLYIFSLCLSSLLSFFQYTPGKFEISRRENRCILKIKNAKPDDASEYSCEVEGDTTTTTLKVEGMNCIKKSQFSDIARCRQTQKVA